VYQARWRWVVSGWRVSGWKLEKGWKLARGRMGSGVMVMVGLRGLVGVAVGLGVWREVGLEIRTWRRDVGVRRVVGEEVMLQLDLGRQRHWVLRRDG